MFEMKKNIVRSLPTLMM